MEPLPIVEQHSYVIRRAIHIMSAMESKRETESQLEKTGREDNPQPERSFLHLKN